MTYFVPIDGHFVFPSIYINFDIQTKWPHISKADFDQFAFRHSKSCNFGYNQYFSMSVFAAVRGLNSSETKGPSTKDVRQNLGFSNQPPSPCPGVSEFPKPPTSP